MDSDELPCDASTLIYLAKADAFAEGARCLGPLVVTPSVWREAVEGERIGAADVPRIREAERSGILHRLVLDESDQQLAESIATEHRLGAGESEVLALGRAIGRAVVDEGRASRVAESLGITPISTLFVPLVGLREQLLSQREALDLLRRLAVVAGARAEVVFALEEELRREDDED
jgi:predicted nucleic acid-binding protein